MAPRGWRDRLLIRIANWFLRRTSKPVRSGLDNIIVSGRAAIDADRQLTTLQVIANGKGHAARSMQLIAQEAPRSKQEGS